MNCGVKSSAECRVQRMECFLCGVGSVDCKVWSLEWKVESADCRVWSVERGV